MSETASQKAKRLQQQVTELQKANNREVFARRQVQEDAEAFRSMMKAFSRSIEPEREQMHSLVAYGNELEDEMAELDEKWRGIDDRMRRNTEHAFKRIEALEQAMGKLESRLAGLFELQK